VSYDRILILGGYGRAGRAVAESLLVDTTAEVMLAGRDGARAKAEAARLASTRGEGRVSALRADARRPAEWKAAAAEADLIIVCAPLRERVGAVAEAALAAGADLIDLDYAPAAWEALRGHRQAAERKKLCFVGQAGLIPGVPALLTRHAAERLGPGAKVACAELTRLAGFSAASATDLLRDLRLTARVFRNGAWRKPLMGGARRFDFGPDFGREKCYPLELTEMASLPGLLKLEELGQYAAGFGSVLGSAILTTWLFLRLNRTRGGARFGGRLLAAALRSAKPPFYTMLKLEAEGRKGEVIQWYAGHEDGYKATAYAVAAALRQLADGSARRPGVHLMGHLLVPGRFFEDAVALGLDLAERFG